MAQKRKIEVYGDGSVVISNIRNDKSLPVLAKNDTITLTKVNQWWDGSVMDDSKVDGKVYVKWKEAGDYFGQYFKVNLPNDKELFLEKDTMQQMRDMSSTEILLLKMNYYKGVKLYGYYQNGDTPAPIEYYLTQSGTDNGVYILDVQDIKLRHTFKGSINPLYFGAKAGLTEDVTPYIQKIFALGFKDVVITSQFLASSYLGIPTVTLQNNPVYYIRGMGGTIHLTTDVNNGWITSDRSLSNPTSTSNLYSSKLYIDGVRFKNSTPDLGNNPDNTPKSGVVVNGDRIYNVFFTNCYFFRIKSVIKSFQSKGSSYPNGYLQSVSIVDNMFIQVGTIVDAYRCFNFTFNENMCEGCEGGVIFKDTTGQPGINVLRVKDNLFEGGGLFFKSGSITSGTISGNYLEANNTFEVVTQKAHIVFNITDVNNLYGLEISNNNFQSTAEQKLDTDFADIKFLGTFSTDAEHLGNVTISNNNTNSYALVNRPERIKFFEGNTMTSEAYLRSRISSSPQKARVSFQRKLNQLMSSQFLQGGVHTICRLNLKRIKDVISNTAERACSGTLHIQCNMKTSGLVTIGQTLVVVDFIIMGASEGVGIAGQINDVYYSFSLRNVLNIAQDKLIDSRFPTAVTKVHFNSSTSVLSASESSDGLYIDLNLSNYTSPVTGNYGAADRIYAFSTIQLNVNNNTHAVAYSIL